MNVSVDGENDTNITCPGEEYLHTHVYYWDELLPQLTVYTFTFIFGVSGNTLIMYTILRYRRMKSITNAFLASLAIADLLLIFICIPVRVSKIMYTILRYRRMKRITNAFLASLAIADLLLIFI